MDLKSIEEEISKQCQSLPRGEYASKALSHSFTVFARDMVEVSPLFLPCVRSVKPIYSSSSALSESKFCRFNGPQLY